MRLVKKKAEQLTARIKHAEVLPGSWKAGVPKGPVAHGNDALLFAVAGLGHQVYGLVVQTLWTKPRRQIGDSWFLAEFLFAKEFREDMEAHVEFTVVKMTNEGSEKADTLPDEAEGATGVIDIVSGGVEPNTSDVIH